MFVFLNKDVVPESDAVVSVYDHGFLYGDGVYETMRAYDGVVFMQENHLDRLSRSAASLNLRLPDKEFIRDAVSRTIAANRLSNAYLRITVSRGKGPIGLDPELCPEPTFVVIAEEFRDYPESWYRDGTTVIFAKTRRNLATAVNPMIKSLNFLNNILAKIEAKAQGAQEAVMLNHEGFIAEGTVSNLFFLKGQEVCTPSLDAGILAGITRDIIIALAKAEGMKVHEGLFTPEDLYTASEVFYTNTTSEVMPVSMVDGRSFGVGEVSRLLRQRYKNEVVKYMQER